MITASLPGNEAWHNTFLPYNVNVSPDCYSNRLELVAPDNYFFGPGSYLSYLRRALSLYPCTPPTLDTLNSWATPAQVPMHVDDQTPQIPPYSVSSALFQLFANSINIFYPTLQDNHLNNLMCTSYAENRPSVDLDRDLFYLVLSVASLAVNGRETGLPIGSHVYFYKATCHPERSRADWLSIDPLLLLQRQILICVSVLFNPESGDLWRNLGFAVRLYFDLSHRPSELDNDRTLLAMLSRTLYCLERCVYPRNFDLYSLITRIFSQVSIAFGRPSLLTIGDKLRDVRNTVITVDVSFADCHRT
jgi:hypothetical protein